MSLLPFFREIPTMSAAQVREFIGGRRPDTYNLVDVRQPREYEKGHLPGAMLVPLGELNDRLAEIDPAKPTIVY